MQRDLLTLNPKKAVIISKYHSPGISYEQVCRYPLKRGAIVEILCEKSAPFVARVCFDVDPVFGKILWTEICVSVNFSAGLSSWLFYQWQKGKRSRSLFCDEIACSIDYSERFWNNRPLEGHIPAYSLIELFQLPYAFLRVGKRSTNRQIFGILLRRMH